VGRRSQAHTQRVEVVVDEVPELRALSFQIEA
jgi:hypothetical protein